MGRMFLTAKELALRWDVDAESLAKSAREGRVPGAFQLYTRQWRFRVRDIEAYEEREIAAVAAVAAVADTKELA